MCVCMTACIFLLASSISIPWPGMVTGRSGWMIPKCQSNAAAGATLRHAKEGGRQSIRLCAEDQENRAITNFWTCGKVTEGYFGFSNCKSTIAWPASTHPGQAHNFHCLGSHAPSICSNQHFGPAGSFRSLHAQLLQKKYKPQSKWSE